MPWDDFTDPESDRPAFVKQELSKIGISLDPNDKSVIGGNAQSPAEIERRKRRAAEQLAKEDRLFGIWPGAFLGVPWSSGDDPQARDD